MLFKTNLILIDYLTFELCCFYIADGYQFNGAVFHGHD